MPEMIEDYYARVMAAADDEGRLAIPSDGIPYWEIFPFEAEGLRLKPIGPLSEVEELCTRILGTRPDVPVIVS